jgi:hypothetical protein
MKFDFWLELPKSLVDLCETEISNDEKSVAIMIENSKNVRKFLILRNLTKSLMNKIFLILKFSLLLQKRNF